MRPRRRCPALYDPTPDDESLSATHDYFWMLRTGVIPHHSRDNWASFQAGYRRAGEDREERERGRRLRVVAG